MGLSNRKESNQDKILGLFQEVGKPMTGEQVVILFEERWGRNATSDVVRTGISALTRNGFLREAGLVESPTTHEPVKTWEVNDGPLTERVESLKPHKQTAKQAQDEITLLLARNKNLEESNLKLLSIIEKLRNEVDALHEKAAGASL